MNEFIGDKQLRWDRIEESARGVRTVAEWKALTENLLTEQPCVFHRNLEISALYAGIYLRKPEWFKWAGMAALASFHVRDGLNLLATVTDSTGRLLADADGQKWAGIPLRDIDVLRRTNNAIFEDIAWAHLCVLLRGEDGLQRAVSGDAELAPLVEAFSAMGSDVWTANLRLLRHEQENMVQPRFAAMSRSFSHILSVGATMLYKDKGLCERKMNGVFYAFMFMRKPRDLFRSRSFPNMTNLEHRWAWISEGIVPGYQCYESATDLMEADLEKIFLSLRDLNKKASCGVKKSDGVGE
ncbi:MAG: hypothetical protein AAGA58_17790 [Verrucomicrobiota bacterium]